MTQLDLVERIDIMRRFNRFYTQHLGVLHETLHHSGFSLPEARVLYELAQREPTIAAEVRTALGLDAGYLSRIIRTLQRRGLIDKQPSSTDGRQRDLRLTAQGRAAFARLNAASHEAIAATLASLSADEQHRLIAAMQTIERLLGAQPEPRVPYILRPPRPGDMGWVVQRHGVLYAREYGWDERFEALVAAIVAAFAQHHDPHRERCWIAEREGENVGSVFLVRETDSVAKLRLLLVEPAARGLGIGKRLVHECTSFARQVGYRKITLWTNSVLHAARHIYERAGFRLVHEEPHHSFGHDLVGQTWELDL